MIKSLKDLLDKFSRFTNSLVYDGGISKRLYNITYSLNSSKTGIIALISYEVNYKIASQKKGDISIALLKKYTTNEFIKLKKSNTKSIKKEDDE